MVKILIVDDEVLVRVGLRTAVNWEEHGFRVVGELADGADALSFLEKYDVDVLLLDVVMPQVSGVEVMRQLNEQGRRIPTIVLSSYDDFEYVRECFRLGARDYILKLSLDPETLLETVKSLELHYHESKTEEIPSRFDPRVVADEESVIRTDDPGLLGEPWAWQTKRIVLIRVVTGEPLKRNIPAILALLNDFSSRTSYSAARELEENVSLLIAPDTGEPNEIQAFCESVAESLERYVNTSARFGISGPFDDWQAAHREYLRARQAVEVAFYSDPPIAMADSTPEAADVVSHRTLLDSDMERRLQRAVEFLDRQEARRVLRELLDRGRNVGLVPDRLFEVFDDAFHVFLRELKLHKSDFSQLTKQEYRAPYQTIRGIASATLLRSLLDRFVSAYFDHLESFEHSVHAERIRKAREFIADNYGSRIGVSDLAAYLHITENYFSHLFKQVEGVSFTDYLNNTRVDNARVFLRTTERTVGEVAEMVGFESIYYFSTVFKKVTGYSPTQYRKLEDRLLNE